MRRRIIPEREIIKLTKDVILSLYNRDEAKAVNYLADDFMWIGAFDFQYTFSKDEFLKVIQSEMNAEPFEMVDEEFSLISKSSTFYVLCAKFKLFAKGENSSIVRTHTRMSIMWKYEDNELKLFHVHGSNAQDIPLLASEPTTTVSPDEKFFTFIESLNSSSSSEKLSFKDTTGRYRYFLESEIIYLEANLQNTFIHTATEKIEVAGLLAVQAKKLPSQFYRIHKSYMVNTLYVTSLKRYTVSLVGDKELPISKDKFIDFRNFKQHSK